MPEGNNSRPPVEGNLLCLRDWQLFLKRMNDVDLSRLTDDERELLGRLLLKAAGELEGEVIPTFRIERILIDPNAAEEK